MSFSIEGIQAASMISKDFLTSHESLNEISSEEPSAFFEEDFDLISENRGEEREDFKEMLAREEGEVLCISLPFRRDDSHQKQNETFIFSLGAQPTPLSDTGETFDEKKNVNSPFFSSSCLSSRVLAKEEFHSEESRVFLQESTDFSRESGDFFQNISDDALSQVFVSDRSSARANEDTFQHFPEKNQESGIIFSEGNSSAEFRDDKNAQKHVTFEPLDLSQVSEKPQESPAPTPLKEAVFLAHPLFPSALKEDDNKVKPLLSLPQENEPFKGEERRVLEQKDFLQKGIEGFIEEKNPPIHFHSSIPQTKPLGEISSSQMPAVLKQISEKCLGMIQAQKSDGSSFVRFQLHPESLGLLEIHLVFREEGLSIHFAGEAATMDLLQKNALQLSQALHQEGFQFNDEQMNFGSLAWKEPGDSGDASQNSSLSLEGKEKNPTSQISDKPSGMPSPGQINILIDTSLNQRKMPGEITLCL